MGLRQRPIAVLSNPQRTNIKQSEPLLRIACILFNPVTLRLLPGLMLLLPRMSPLAHAALIDDVSHRCESRTALDADTPP